MPISPATPRADGFVFIDRVLDAPREVVFAAWSNVERLRHWYAPRGCRVDIFDFDFRVGGGARICIGSPQGGACWARCDYLEIAPPHRIVYALTATDAEGIPTDPGKLGMDPDWPRQTTVTVTFTDRAGKTQLTLHQTASEALAKRTGAHPSWLEMLDRLGEHVSQKS